MPNKYSLLMRGFKIESPVKFIFELIWSIYVSVMFAKSSGYSNGKGGDITKAVRILWLGTIQSGSEGSIGGNAYKERVVYSLHCKYSNQ